MFELIIIGGGPSGITCAVEAKRYGIEPLLIEKNQLGGSLWYARKIENYPPFYCIEGERLASRFKNLLIKRKINYIFDEVIKIIFRKDFFEIETSKEKIYHSKTLYVATGQKEILPKEYFHFKDYISFPSYFPKNKKIRKSIVYGGGDVGIDFSLKLLEKGIETTTFCRTKKAKKSLLDEAKKIGLKIYEGFILKDILQEKSKKKAIFADQMGNEVVLEFELLYFALGKEADFSLFNNIEEIHNSEDNGLFLGGDLVNGKMRNIGIAVGDGIKGAFKIFNFLRRKR